ncbi:MAG TPA: hypothetical protein VF265_04620 [Nevskiaceae bacterium]
MSDDARHAFSGRLDPRALPALIAGILWLAVSEGWGGAVLAILPGVGLIASSGGVMFWPGEPRHARLMALSGVVGVLFALPAFGVDGWRYALMVLILSAVSFVCAGRLALISGTRPAGVPTVPQGWLANAKAALDAALMGYFVLTARIPTRSEMSSFAERAARLEAALTGDRATDGAVEGPERVDAPHDAELLAMHTRHLSGERLSFPSRYRAPSEGADAPRWLAHAANARCQALVFRQRQPEHHWLVGIHGYRMGPDWLNTALFPPRLLMQQLGCNLMLPVLPLHGARKVGWRTGDYYMDGDPLNLLYAQSQALSDLRHLLAWIRDVDADARIGVLGYSLGGLNAALLAAWEPALDFVVAGIPLADPAAIVWPAVPPSYRRGFEAQGVDAERYARLLEGISPLSRAPLVPRARLTIFAGAADCIVPPDQPERLSRHWGVPVHWYTGGHLTFRNEPVVMNSLHDMAGAAGWT